VSYREIAKALDKSIQGCRNGNFVSTSRIADIYNTGIYLAGGGSMLRS
jgi:actin-like ATPase involved in cell morphogenesis